MLTIDVNSAPTSEQAQEILRQAKTAVLGSRPLTLRRVDGDADLAFNLRDENSAVRTLGA